MTKVSIPHVPGTVYAQPPIKPTISFPVDASGIPMALKVQKIWAIWKHTLKQDKWTKPPYKLADDGYSPYAHANKVSHRWSYGDCSQVYNRGGADGIGIMCDENVVALDLDDAVLPGGGIRAWAQELIERFDSYTEYSPSGKGLRIIMFCGSALDNRDKVMPDGGKVQFFSNSHFFTVTGANAADWPHEVKDCTADLVQWHAAFFPPKVKQTTPDASTGGGGGMSLSDQELRDEMFGNRKNGDKIRRLWEGDPATVASYKSPSEAAFALMGYLSSYTNKDAGRIKSMFLASGFDWAGKSDGSIDTTVEKAILKTTWIWRGKPTNTVDHEAKSVADIFAEEQERLKAQPQSGGNVNASTQTNTPPQPTNGTGQTTAQQPGSQQTGGTGGAASGTTGSTPPPPTTTFPVLTLQEFLRRPSKVWLVDRVIGKQEIGMIFGPSGEGKTFAAIDLMICACLGQKWAGQFDIPKPLTVVYAYGEGGEGLPDRFRAAMESRGITDIPNFFIIPVVPQLFDARRSDGVNTFIRDLAAMPAAGMPPVDLLFIDTQHTATVGADENSAKDMGIVLDNARKVMSALGCSVELIHHTDKSGERERGSSSLHGATVSMIKIRKNGEHHMECKKLKDGEQWKPLTFTLIAKGNSVYPHWDSSTPSPGDARHSGDRQEIIDLLLAGRGKSYTAKEITDGIGSQSQTNVRAILKNLVRDKNVETVDYGEGKKPRWGYQINDAWAALQGMVGNP